MRLCGYSPDNKLVETTRDGQCHFNVASVGPGRVASVASGCFSDANLSIVDLQSGAATAVDGLGPKNTELATSPDNALLLYTKRTPNGLGFYVFDLVKKKKRLVAVKVTDRVHVQPSFVSPKQAVFLSESKVWSLDTTSGAITDLLALPKAAGPRGGP